MTDLTIDQNALLHQLADGPQPYRETPAERGLIDADLVEITGTAEIELTARGRRRVGQDAAMLSTWLDKFR